MSRPLNGVRAMTREERNARMRELMKDPERRARARESKKRYERKHAASLADAKRRREQKRRAEDPSYVERERERAREYQRAHREENRARARAWREANKERERAKARARYRADREYRERHIAAVERRRQLLRADPEYRARLAAQHRAYYARLKATGRLRNYLYRTYLLRKWEKVAAGGRERIAAYMRRARPDNRRMFVAWYARQQGLINRTRGLGRIEQERDGVAVAR